LNLGINLLLLNFALDFYFTPLLDPASAVSFTRVGAVSPDSAKISIRYPFDNATEGTLQVIYRQAIQGELLSAATNPWKDGPIATVYADSDWTTVVKLTGLWPSTPYECPSYPFLADAFDP
jgi:alkaline phosphatase D